jgi:hypothetical protein
MLAWNADLQTAGCGEYLGRMRMGQRKDQKDDPQKQREATAIRNVLRSARDGGRGEGGYRRLV